MAKSEVKAFYKVEESYSLSYKPKSPLVRGVTLLRQPSRWKVLDGKELFNYRTFLYQSEVNRTLGETPQQAVEIHLQRKAHQVRASQHQLDQDNLAYAAAKALAAEFGVTSDPLKEQEDGTDAA